MGVSELHALRLVGDGDRVVVLAHGLGGNQHQWDPVARHLAAHARVISFALAGSADCDPAVYSPERHASLLGFADDLARICADQGLRGATYVGHSMSGMVGMLAAAADPGLFSRLVVIGTSACYLDDPTTGYVGGRTREEVDTMLAAVASDFALWSGGFAPQVMGNPERPEFSTEFAKSLRRYPPQVALSILRTAYTSDYRDVVPRVSPPTLVLQARGDTAVPDAAATWLADALPDGRLIHLAAQGHFPHVVDPDEVCAAIDAFIEETVP